MYALITNPSSSDSHRLGVGSCSLAVWFTGALVVTSEVSLLILCCSETTQASNKELLIRPCG